METTIIHIGYHKSASTYLQQHVFPKLPVNFLFFAGERRRYLNMIESETELDDEAIRNWVQSELALKYPQRHEVTVLSHEELSGHPHGYKSISPFITAGNLKTVFPEAKILIMIRNQLAYITSLYTFRVAIKGRETRSFTQFLSEEKGKGLYDHLDYPVLIHHYQQLFGNENVAVIPMELLLTSPNDFYARLFSFLGIPVQPIEKARPSNVSTKSEFLLRLWRLVNAQFNVFLDLRTRVFGPSPDNFQRTRSTYYNVKRAVTGSLNPLLGKSRAISIPISADDKQRFAESNRRLQALIEIDLSRLGYPVSSQEVMLAPLQTI
jgi:hypothetical protein